MQRDGRQMLKNGEHIRNAGSRGGSVCPCRDGGSGGGGGVCLCACRCRGVDNDKVGEVCVSPCCSVSVGYPFSLHPHPL